MTGDLQINSPEWRKRVCDGARGMGLCVDMPMAEKMARHCIELMTWNRKINLTAITDPLEVAVKHVLDSLAALPLMPGGASVLDLGSGGGFPGLVLKIADPSLLITLVDSSRKKISFLRQVIRLLSLKGIEAIHARTEEIISQNEFFEGFDRVTCRAFTSLSGFVGTAWSFVKKGGLIVAYKGKGVDEEIKGFGSGLSGGKIKGLPDSMGLSIEVRPYVLPYLNIERALVVIKKPG